MASDNPPAPIEETSVQPTTTYTPPVMASSSTTSRRSTITGFRALPTPPQPAALPLPVTTKDGACTHMSVTRLYTTEFSCQVCGETGPMGWIFRCTQDRENMIEHDLGAGVYDRIDDLCDVLETSNNPKKRSPAARESPLSLLDEMTEAQLATYTPAQIAILLKQRANLQKVLATTNVLHAQTHAAQALHRLQQQFGLTPAPNGTPPSNTTFQFLPTPSALKPWVPLKECQFKACARCRSSFREKSYLRLDAILNNDIPATASMGFGFHLIGERPVAPVNIVKNLGLRPNPEPTDMSSSSTYSSDAESEASSSSPEALTMAQLPLSLRRRLATLNLYGAGLGIDADGNDIANPVPQLTTPINIIFSADELAAVAASPSFNPSNLKAKERQAENKAENWYTNSNNSTSNLAHHRNTSTRQIRSPQTHTFALPSSPSFSALSQAERGQGPSLKPRKMPIRKPTRYPKVEKQVQMPKIVVTNEDNVAGDVDVDTSDTAYDSEEDSGEESESLRRTREVFRQERSSSLRVVIAENEDDEKDIVEQKIEESDAADEDDKQEDLMNPRVEENEALEEDDKKLDLMAQNDEAGGNNTLPSTPFILKDGGVAVTEESIEEGVPDIVI